MTSRGRSSLGRAALVLLLGALACSGEPEPSSGRPNVLLVSIDTLRADHLGAYGYERPTSPFLDRIAADGIVFENCIAQSTWTHPSHAALMTSRYPTDLGLHGYPEPGRIDDSFATLAEVLRDEGYDTAAFTDGGWVTEKFGFAQGFREFDQEAGHLRRILPRAEAWLGERRASPFFVFLHTYDVHLYDPPDWAARALVRPYSGTPERSGALKNGVQNWNDDELLESLDEEDLRYIIDLYDASILHVDDFMQRLVDSLEDEGLWDDTILVITSDHGEEFLEHERMGHGYSNYEEEIRVPLIVRLPGDAHAGLRIERPVRSIDVMPTLLELVGASGTPPGMRGTSLVPLLEGEPLDLPPAFTEKGHVPHQSLRAARFKVIHDPETGEHRIYDLLADPGERSDLGGDAPPEAIALKDALALQIQELARPGLEADAVTLTPEERQALQALGYLGDQVEAQD